MKYNINVIKFVWRQLRKPSRVTLDAATLPTPLSLWNIGTNSGACAITSQNSQKTPLMRTLNSAVWQHIARLQADRRNFYRVKHRSLEEQADTPAIYDP